MSISLTQIELPYSSQLNAKYNARNYSSLVASVALSAVFVQYWASFQSCAGIMLVFRKRCGKYASYGAFGLL